MTARIGPGLVASGPAGPAGTPGAAGAAGVGSTFPQSALIVYVDYVNGSDANNGFGPTSAYKTIQAAYNALKTYAEAHYSGQEIGVGRILMLPGDHDVGTGVAIDSRRPCEILGSDQGHRTHGASGSAARIMSSSGAVTEFITVSNAGIGHGFTMKGVSFVVNHTLHTSLTSVIKLTDVDDWTIMECNYSTDDSVTNMDIPFVWQTSRVNGDAAWSRLIANKGSRLALFYGDGAGGNFNRSWHSQNRIFYGGNLPMWWMNAATSNSNWIVANNFEGNAIAVQMGPTGAHRSNYFSNGGEGSGGSGDTTNPYYECLGSVNLNIIDAGECHNSGGGLGIWARFDTNAYNNMIIGAADSVGTAGFKRKVVDTSTYGNRIYDPRFGLAPKVKTGTAPTISNADFASTPPDGTDAYTYGSTGPVYKHWVKLNGVWVSNTMA